MFWRLFESIHGHLGVLTVAALVHPALLLRQGKPLTRRNRWAVGLSTAFTLAVYGTGIAMYGAYRALVHLRGRGYGEALQLVRGALPPELADPDA